MSRRRKTQVPTASIEKALVTVPAPRRSGSIFLVGQGEQAEYRVNPSKRERALVYYEMYRQHPTVRAGVEKIAKTAAANGYRFIPTEPDEEVPADKAKFLKLFFRLSNANQLLRLTYRDLLIFGEAYWLVVGAKMGRPVKAMRLHPMYMDARIEGGQFVGWRYGPIFESDQAIKYEAEEVLHFKLDDPNSDVYGLSPLDSLQHTVATDLFAMRFNKKFFENSASSGLILSMKNSTKEEVDRNREWLDQNYTGTENAWRTMVLEGDIEVKDRAGKLNEMQFIEGRKFNRQEILAALDIDPSKLGITEDSNRSTSKEADNTFRQETISPLQGVVEEEINNAFILGLLGWDDVLFEQEESSMRDKLDLMKMLAEGERMGVFSVNDILGVLGRKKLKDEGADTHFVQTAAGLIPLELLDNVAERLIPQQVQPASGVGTDNAPDEEDEEQDDPDREQSDDQRS
jgi:HK97 family phage portal protein